jgi:hypothetical protein
MTGKSDRLQELMDDPDIKQAFENVRQHIIDMFMTTNSEDAEALMDIRKRVIALDAVEQDLRVAIQDGHLEDLRAIEETEDKL